MQSSSHESLQAVFIAGACGARPEEHAAAPAVGAARASVGAHTDLACVALTHASVTVCRGSSRCGLNTGDDTVQKRVGYSGCR